MHPNPIFHGDDAARDLGFARNRGFGVLAVSQDGAPLISHVPFLLSQDGASADLHLVRSNPIARLGDVAARLVVNGPDGYVSPDWYDAPEQVPTWNYVSVELTGRLEPLPAEELEPLLTRETAFFEARLPKTPWKIDKMDRDAFTRMLRMIVPYRFHVDEVHSTWKLNQNKTQTARMGAADQINTGIGSELGTLSALMQNPPGSTPGE
jgi:transcriptional regulator